MLQALLSGVIALGEIPSGQIADWLGCNRALVLSQALLLMARALLLSAYLPRSLVLFALEAVVEGLSACLASGTDSAYLYACYGEGDYLPRTARAANWGTAAFILSTLAYAELYRLFGLERLLWATLLSGTITLTCAALLPREKEMPQSLPVSIRQLSGLMIRPRAALLVGLLAVISLAWLLLNFFYVDKLAQCGLPEEAMPAVILAYSAIQLLGEPVLHRLSGLPAKG